MSYAFENKNTGSVDIVVRPLLENTCHSITKLSFSNFSSNVFYSRTEWRQSETHVHLKFTYLHVKQLGVLLFFSATVIMIHAVTESVNYVRVYLSTYL